MAAPRTNGNGADASGEVKESIEARTTRLGTGARGAADADANGEADPDVSANGNEDADADEDDDVEMTDAAGPAIHVSGQQAVGPTRSKKDLLHLIEVTAQYLSSYEDNGVEITSGFQRIPNKRLLPDYFDVIKEPTAFSTIRGRVQKRVYTAFTEFVRDAALICHNAQVYNRPSAPIFQDAVRLREVLKEKLQQMVRDGTIEAAEAELPDLGEIPDSPDLPDAEGDEDEEEEDDEDEDEESESDEDEDDDDSRRGRRQGRRSGRGAQKNTGRGAAASAAPPRMITPMEGRVNAVLAGLRKARDEDDEPLLEPFETLPDRELLPEYYEEIKQPMAVDLIKRKARRKQYGSVDDALADLELMFHNAQVFNEDGSAIFEAAVTLQGLARQLVAAERAKPDNAFRDEQGRLALAAIQHMGQVWRIGDWVLVRNASDPSKPVVAQIFAAWIDLAGLGWVRVAWYYRPEQTVHRFDKHFYENEVFRTDGLHDHGVGEVVDRCVVLPVAQYARGRPRGFPTTKPVFVCDARYSEATGRFTRIQSWDACVPEEVRGLDYALDLYAAPRRLVKVMPSPIQHLLRDDAEETDVLPLATRGHANAPPMIGAVHRRPRRANESPPPDPALLESVRQSSLSGGAPPAGFLPPGVPPSALTSPSPHAIYAQQQFVPRPPSMPLMPGPRPGMPLQQQQPPQQSLPPHHHMLQPLAAAPGVVPAGGPGGSPHFVSPQPLQRLGMQQIVHMSNGTNGTHGTNGTIGTNGNGTYTTHNNSMVSQPLPPQQAPQHRPMGTPSAPMGARRVSTATPGVGGVRVTPVMPPHVSAIVPPPVPTGYVPPRATAEAYVLPADMEAKIPEDVRAHYHRDRQGRVLFFTSPSVGHAAEGTADGAVGVAAEYTSLGHSTRYLSGLDAFRAERQRQRAARDEQLAREAEATAVQRAEAHAEAAQQLYSTAGEALGGFVQWMNSGTQQLLGPEGGGGGAVTTGAER